MKSMAQDFKDVIEGMGPGRMICSLTTSTLNSTTFEEAIEVLSGEKKVEPQVRKAETRKAARENLNH